jgi:hypothetical protein
MSLAVLRVLLISVKTCNPNHSSSYLVEIGQFVKVVCFMCFLCMFIVVQVDTV